MQLREMATIGSLVVPLTTSLSTALILCVELKTPQHCGSVHTQLDLLETSLLDGSYLIASQGIGLEGVAVSESAGRIRDLYDATRVHLWETAPHDPWLFNAGLMT
jgi:hypothetical protein